MKTGVVEAINSNLLIVEGIKYFIGDQKADGIEKGDTVGFDNLDNKWLTQLELIQKGNGNGRQPATAKKKEPATKTGEPVQTCKFGPCPDGKNHFVHEKQRNRWECECLGQEISQLSKCSLEYRKEDKILSDPALDAKAKASGFGTPPTDPPAAVPDDIKQVFGIYLGMGKDKVMLQIEGKNEVYNADPELVKYLSRKDCKAVPDMSVTLELKDLHDGRGFLATQIGAGPEKQTPPPADQPAGQQVQQPPATAAQQPVAAKSPAAAARPVTSPGAAPSFHKARRSAAKLRVGLCGTAGSGKSMGALLVALGIEGPIAVIDTENSSAELYAHMGDYDVCVLQAPFTPQKYTDAIHAAERAGYNVIIIDSLTHAWAGEGGLLDMKDNITKNSKSSNSFTAWKDVTPLHRGLVEAMLQSPSHIIATMRSKTEYVIDTDDRGRSFPRKIGMAPVQREGMDYEFTLVFDIDAAHIATASKDRTSLFTGKAFQISQETGRQLKDWLNTESPGGA